MVANLFPDIDMINECEKEMTNSITDQDSITDDDIIHFVVSYDPPGNCIPPTRKLFEILEDNGCEEIKSLWGAQMPKISHETEAIKLNNDKILIRNCVFSSKVVKSFLAFYTFLLLIKV